MKKKVIYQVPLLLARGFTPETYFEGLAMEGGEKLQF